MIEELKKEMTPTGKKINCRLCGRCFVAMVKVRICKKEQDAIYRCSRSGAENELDKGKHKCS